MVTNCIPWCIFVCGIHFILYIEIKLYPSMTRNCHNHTQQTYPSSQVEETKSTHSLNNLSKATGCLSHSKMIAKL